jgi:hypothetical protein
MQVNFHSSGAEIKQGEKLIAHLDRHNVLTVFATPKNKITRFHTKPSDSEILMKVALMKKSQSQ